jgi:acid stress-induced BolA-like protein IbaG/YrbA
MGNNVIQPVGPLDKYEVIVSCRKVEGYAKLQQERFVKAFIGAEKCLTSELKSSKPEFVDIHEVSLKVTNSLGAEKKIKATTFLIK